MIQVSYFDIGGFVLHKIQLGEHTYSAWFDKSGRLLDCERTTNHQSTTVPTAHRNIRSEITKIGQRYVK